MDHFKLKKESEQLCKEALDQLIFKDNIINDLQTQLEQEREENFSLRKRCDDLENKLALIDDNLDINDSQNIKNKTVLFNNTNKPINTEDNFFQQKYLVSSVEGAFNFNSKNYNNPNQSSEMAKIIEENNTLQTKYAQLEAEYKNYLDKNKNLMDIEGIYKQQLEQQKKKIEFFERQAIQLKERDNYIEELIERSNNLEKDYEQIISNKDIENKELITKISIIEDNNDRLKNQLNVLSQNSNNFTQELMKEIRMLDEKNKELEMNTYKAEIVYKEEIKKLQRLLNDNIKKENNEESQNPNSKSLKVEDLATSLTKSIKERIDSQNKKISNQNVEILSLQYEVEKLASEMRYEKELNEKLQRTLAEQKYKFSDMINSHTEKEEAQVQTVLKMDDLESNKIKSKILDDNLIKMTERFENSDKMLKSLEEKYEKILKVKKERESEIEILIKKLDKLQKGEKLTDRETLNGISNISKLNMTISVLKLRENQLTERIQSLESELLYSNNKNNYNSRDAQISRGKEDKFPNKSNNTRGNIPSMQSVSFNISEESNNVNMLPNQGILTYPDNMISSNNYNREAESNEHFRLNKPKDILNEKYELELKQMREDNYFLREQNFKFMSDLNRIQEQYNSCRLDKEAITQDIEQLQREKAELKMYYETTIKHLENELEKSKQINNYNIEEMRDKLNTFSDLNIKMNDQFTGLQNKFYVQSQLIQEKNNDLINEKKISENLEKDINKWISENDAIKDKLSKTLNELNLTKKENENYKKELSEIKSMYSELNNKSSFMINEVQERSKILNAENENLKEMSSKLKNKLNEMYEENKEKESKLINLLKEENKEIESRLRGELIELREENETLMKERSTLRLTNNELKYELGILKDRVNESNKQTNLNLSRSQSNSNNFERSGNSNINNKNNKKLLNSSNNNVNFLNSENELKNIQEENLKLKCELEEYKTNLNNKEKNLNSLKLDFQSSEIERQRLLDLMKNKENELKMIKSDLLNLNDNFKKFQEGENIDQLLSEISSKNQTINYLIDEVEKVKKESKDRINELEKNLIKSKDENENLTQNLNSLNKEFQKQKEYNTSVINDLQNENEILLKDIEDKDKELESVTKMKIRMENDFEEKFKNNDEYYEKIVQDLKLTKEENLALQRNIEEVAQNSIEKFDKIDKKQIKSRIKIEHLISVYENHIKFLKDRFNYILNDLYILLNIKSSSAQKDTSGEKFIKLIKNVENSVDLISNISEREAIIENQKQEIKQLKGNLINVNNNVKRLLKENEEMNELLNIRKLQMKIPNNRKTNNTSINLLNFESCIKELADLRIKDNNTRIKMQSSTAEIKMLNDNINHLKEINENSINRINTLETELSKKEKDIMEINKSHKVEILKILEELKKIKERWATPEKQEELSSTIVELEKQVKGLKEDVNRKRELISTLKSQLSQFNEQNNNLSNSVGPNNSNLEEKIKILNKEVLRKDNMIKDLKTALESIKSSEKKLSDENTLIQEKNKISKIDISRKDIIIKELKEKLKEATTNLSTENSIVKNNDEMKEVIKKIRNEVERKDGIIKTLKAKLETVNMEIEQLRNLNLKLSKSNSYEVEKEQKQQENIRNKLDHLTNQNENLMSVVRRIFKDLISTYERLKSKSNIISNTQGLKEGLEILGVTQDELDEYLSPPDKLELYDRVNSLLDNNNIEAETFMNIYISIQDKISSLQKDSIKNLDSGNTFYPSYNNYSKSSSPFNDNPFNSKYSNK